MADYKKILGFLKVDSIVEDLVAIVEAKIELLKIELKEEAAKAVTKIISAVVLALLLFLILIFVSITIATLLNHFLESRFWGFAIVTAFYLLLLVAFKLFRVGEKLEKRIEMSLSNFEEENTETSDSDEQP